jgi:hypothetical protein
LSIIPDLVSRHPFVLVVPRQRMLLVVEGHQHDRQVFEQLLGRRA